MGIQFKGVNPQLLTYKTKLETKTLFSDKMIEKVIRTKEQIDNLPEKENVFTKIGGVALATKGFVLASAGIIADELEKKSRKKELMARTNCTEDEIAVDINELIEKGNRRKPIRVYGESIRYSAQINTAWLTKIETIWGDAHLEALQDFSCLSSLKSVWGNLYFAQSQDSKVDLSPLQIKMVYGDIHAEKAISTDGLDGLLAVGGSIYFQDKVYDLESFQAMLETKAKEQQK